MTRSTRGSACPPDVLKANKLIFLGEFNARVDTDYAAWRKVRSPHGLVSPPVATDPAAITNVNHYDAPSNSNTTTANNNLVDLVLNCPNCNRTFTSRTGLVGYLRIQSMEPGKPGPEAPKYSRRV
ncbi:unnamed protein product [Schistocephalus solidus]|uniref:C2H2-type domain-containing protein n=1 Tax=Schistocephalus solidus TaxID=70667 RepID=A0A183TC17_SCHSO|nr:unnamed protein product [Schistocephalus solidus]